MRKIISLFVCLMALSAQAATYFVDWTTGNDANPGTIGSPIKRGPGMTGYTGSITPAAGDIFLFKRDETWPSSVFPWTIANSGTGGNPIIYSSSASFATGGGALPIFDGNHVGLVGGMITATGRSNLTFDSLSIINAGTTGVYDQLKAAWFINCQNVTFSNCKFQTFSWLAIYHELSSSGTYTNFNVTNCEATDCGSLMWVGAAANNITINGITITGTWIHDFTSKIGGTPGADVHSDGLLHTFRGGSTGYVLTGLNIQNNRVTGDFRRSFGTSGGVTNFCSIENGGSGLISNNIIAPSPTAASLAESYLGGGYVTGQAITFANNVCWATGTNPASGGLLFYPVGGSITLENNIVMGFTYALNIQGTSYTLVSNFNRYVSSSGQFYNGTATRTYVQWQSDGYDTNSVLGVAPTFVSAPSNMMLAVGSNAIGTGTNLAGIFTTGITSGAVWPNPAISTRAGIWDIGPYVVSGGALTSTSLPNTDKTALGSGMGF